MDFRRVLFRSESLIFFQFVVLQKKIKDSEPAHAAFREGNYLFPCSLVQKNVFFFAVTLEEGRQFARRILQKKFAELDENAFFPFAQFDWGNEVRRFSFPQRPP